MKRRVASLLLLWALAFCATAQTNRLSVTTLNCNAFFGGGETKMQLGQPRTMEDFWSKAENLVNLWPTNPPTFIGLQEIGGAREVVYLSRLAATRYHHSFQPIFADTKDTYTEEAVAGVVDVSQGWGIVGKPGRDPELDQALSKHLVVKLTNNLAALEICVVHLRRPLGKYATLQQRDQNAALKNWAAGRLAKNPQANLIVLGDFNEAKPPGDPAAAVAALTEPAGPLRDAFLQTTNAFHTHANGRAYDRLLFSESLLNGTAGFKFRTVLVQRHKHGKGAEKHWFTDHFPVTAGFDPLANK